MDPLTCTLADIRRLASRDLPGSIVLAEHAIDRHADAFTEPAARSAALDALASDLTRLGRADPHLSRFLHRVDEYIGIVQRER